MSQIDTLNNQGLLAMAAYAEISQGIVLSEALEAIGMSNTQAISFAETWAFVDQYTDASRPYGAPRHTLGIDIFK